VDVRASSASFLGLMRAKNRLQFEDGGSIISQPLLVQYNETAVTYAGADVLPSDEQEEFSGYELPWKQAQVSVTIKGIDKARVSGKRKQLDFVRNKIESAYIALFKKMAGQVFANGTGNGGKDWDGMGAAINNASGFQVYLGIDRLANPWFQSQVFNPGTPTAINTGNMMTLFLQTKTDEETIHVLVTTNNTYALYWAQLTPSERFVDSTLASLGFDNIAFQGKVMVQDSNCPAGTIYYVNLDHVRMVVHRDVNFKFSDFQTPVNQDTDTGHVFVYGNFENRNPKASGIYQNILNG
ncbi:MAG: phage major capsid protein, partial [Vulcanimicrobiaceae bacterium]